MFVDKAQAQENLVPNSSFEEMLSCPGGIADFSVSDWYAPTWGTCDYFNSCNGLDANVPNNYFGHQTAQQGNAYVGFGAIFDSSSNLSSREYVQVELTEELSASKFYHFSCFINKSDSSSICVSEIGIAFSSYPIGGLYLDPIPFAPQITSPVSTYMCDSNGWIQIEGIYLPSGGEKYLTIGYFKNNQDADTLNSHYSSQGAFAYYYIDNVVLRELDDLNSPNVFSPNGDGINDFWCFPINNLPIQILNRWGEVVVDCENGIWDGKTREGKECSDGVYFYVVRDKNFDFNGFIQLIR